MCFVELRRPFSTGSITLCGGEPATLQAMEEEPPLLAERKDKSMVESVAITPEKEPLTQPDIVNSTSLPFLETLHPVAHTSVSLFGSRDVVIDMIKT